MSQTPNGLNLTSEIPSSASKREQAYQRLRRLLILQQVPKGVRLSETEWTKRLNVNRSALREAFARLEAEGLIRLGSRTGYVVPELKKSDIHEILAVRLMLECGAVEIVCRDGLNTADRLETMRDACDQLERLTNENYPLSVAEADWRFHEALIDATGNQRLAHVYLHAPLPIIFPDVLYGPSWEARVRRTASEHRTILGRLLENRPSEACELLRHHLMGHLGEDGY